MFYDHVENAARFSGLLLERESSGLLFFVSPNVYAQMALMVTRAV
jgi:hypothetical protein